jgi:hypothetical protein
VRAWGPKGVPSESLACCRQGRGEQGLPLSMCVSMRQFIEMPLLLPTWLRSGQCNLHTCAAQGLGCQLQEGSAASPVTATNLTHQLFQRSRNISSKRSSRNTLGSRWHTGLAASDSDAHPLA